MPPAPFVISPALIDDLNGPFEWNGRCYHFTYSGFFQLPELLAVVARATSTPVLGYSLCQEDTSYTHADGHEVAGHEHTHWAVIFKKPLGLKGSRKFDVYVGTTVGGHDAYAHPNVQKATFAQMETIMTQYHTGRKYDVEKGQSTYKKPILLVQMLPQQFAWTRAIIEEVNDAPSLLEACVIADVRPRTVNDLKALRDESAQVAKRFKHKFDKTTFKTLPLPLPLPHFLHIWGGTGLGKSKWAAAMFKNPCYQKPFNDIGCVENLLRKFDPNIHDGIVLDEADFRFMSGDTMKAFTDPDEDCTLTVRFKSFELVTVPKIAVSNPSPQQLYPPDPDGAIARRVTLFHITEPTYHAAPLLARPPPPLLATGIVHMRDAAARAAAVAFGTQ